tara:strand:+ start:213 stop:989 length:777 start_codon:yes stop_codon:yes gene_type:complete
MKKRWPKVTVILPFFKKIRFFKKTFNSILIQNYKHIEIIIVYDDPNRNELNQVNKIIKGHKNVKVILNKKNIGAGLSRNRGIKNATGKYIAFLDCDDVWKKNKLKKQVEIMKKDNIPFSFTTYEIIGENGNKLNKKVIAKNLNYEKLIKSCDIGLSTVIVEKKIISKFKFPDLLTKEDFVVWLKIAKKENQLIGINQNLCYWRKSQNSLSSSSLQKFFDAFKVFYFFEKKNIFLSILFTIRLSFNFLLKYYFRIEKRI